MDERPQGLVIGSILILLGIGLLAVQLVGGFGDAVLFFLLGGAFIAGYLYRGAYGLLVPGGILLGIGLGELGQQTGLAFGDIEGIGLGIGFISIYVIALVYERSTHWWPLVPGLILIVLGVVEGNADLERLVEVGWPLILVLIGLILLAGAFGFTGRRDTG